MLPRKIAGGYVAVSHEVAGSPGALLGLARSDLGLRYSRGDLPIMWLLAYIGGLIFIHPSKEPTEL